MPGPFTEHTAVVDDVTDFTPSPDVTTVGANEPPTVPEPGIFEIDGEVDVPLPIVNDWGSP
jgi:hypothetical protein